MRAKKLILVLLLILSFVIIALWLLFQDANRNRQEISTMKLFGSMPEQEEKQNEKQNGNAYAGTYVSADDFDTESEYNIILKSGKLYFKEYNEEKQKYVKMKTSFTFEEPNLKAFSDFGCKHISYERIGNLIDDFYFHTEIVNGHEIRIISLLMEELDGRGLFIISEMVNEEDLQYIQSPFHSELKKKFNGK